MCACASLLRSFAKGPLFFLSSSLVRTLLGARGIREYMLLVADLPRAARQMTPFEDVLTGMVVAVAASGAELVAVHAPLGTFAASAGRYANKTEPLSALRQSTVIWHESHKRADRILEVHHWAMCHHCLPLERPRAALFSSSGAAPKVARAKGPTRGAERVPQKLVSPQLACPYTHSNVIMHRGHAAPTALLWPSCEPTARWLRCHQRAVGPSPDRALDGRGPRQRLAGNLSAISTCG